MRWPVAKDAESAYAQSSIDGRAWTWDFES